MRKIDINDVINEVLNDINEKRKQGMLKALEKDANLADIFCFLNIKKSIVASDKETITTSLRNPELFLMNYGALSGLLNDDSFIDAFGTKVQEAIYIFSYEGRNMLENKEIELVQNREQAVIIYEVINELITDINSVIKPENEKKQLKALRKLVISEETDISNLSNNLIADNSEYLRARYIELLNKELLIYTIYYLMDEENVFFDPKVLKSARPYLERLENLYQNYKNYNFFEKKVRIRE